MSVALEDGPILLDFFRVCADPLGFSFPLSLPAVTNIGEGCRENKSTFLEL